MGNNQKNVTEITFLCRLNGLSLRGEELRYLGVTQSRAAAPMQQDEPAEVV